MSNKDKFAEENSLGYNIHIVGKHFQLTEPIRKHVLDKLVKIEKFHNHLMDVHVILDIEKIEHICVINCHFNHLQVKVEAHSTDMYVSIDKAMHKLQGIFRKWKGKIQDYHKVPMQAVDMVVNVHGRPPIDETEEINEEIEAESLKTWMPGEVIGTETHMLKLLSLEQAIVKLELSRDPFMPYRNLEDGKLRLVYRREDGNYGIIHLEG